MPFLHLSLHGAAAVLGMLLGFFSPPQWHLPIFLSMIALTVVTVIAAHAEPDPKLRSPVARAALFMVHLLLGGPGDAVQSERGSLCFTFALLLSFGFVGGLFLAHHVV